MRLIAAALPLLTMACMNMSPENDDVPAAGETGYTCDAEGLGDLVGREATQALGAEALRTSGSRTLRWIRPGDAVTMDYRPDRLNIHLDGEGRVERFQCG